MLDLGTSFSVVDGCRLLCMTVGRFKALEIRVGFVEVCFFCIVVINVPIVPPYLSGEGTELMQWSCCCCLSSCPHLLQLSIRNREQLLQPIGELDDLDLQLALQEGHFVWMYALS